MTTNLYIPKIASSNFIAYINWHHVISVMQWWCATHCIYLSNKNSNKCVLDWNNYRTWKARGLILLSMTSVRQNASIRSTNNFPYIALRVTHKWELVNNWIMIINWSMQIISASQSRFLKIANYWQVVRREAENCSACQRWPCC